MRKKMMNDTGAAFAEYSIAVGAVIIIFAIISSVLYSSGQQRAEKSVDSMRNMAPCIQTGNDAPALLEPPGCPTDYTGKHCCYP